MYAFTFIATDFLSIFKEVLRPPREVATKSRFPLFDGVSGFISGSVIVSIPLLILTFMFAPFGFLTAP
jgi:hypothetical protein